MVKEENNSAVLAQSSQRIQELENKVENLEEMVSGLKKVNELNVIEMGRFLAEERNFWLEYNPIDTDLNNRVLLSQRNWQIQQICGLEQIIADDFEKSFKVRQENNQLQAKLENLEQEIAELKERQSRLEKTPEDLLNAQLHWYQTNYPDYFEELEKIKKDLDSRIEIFDFISLLEKKINRLTEQINKRPTKANYRALEIAKEELAQEKEDFIIELARLEKESIDKSELLTSTQAELQAERNKKELLGQENDKLKLEKAKLENTKAKLAKDLAIEQRKAISKAEKLKLEKARSAELLANYEESLAELDKINLDYQNLAKDKTTLAEALTAKEREFNTLAEQLSKTEQEITQKLIAELQLGLNADSNLEQVISTLKVLLDKLPIERLAQQLEKVNQINKELSEQIKTQAPEEKIIIQKDTDLIKNYQKLAQELASVKKQNQSERYFFITALALGLAVMGRLLIKLKRLQKRIR